LIIFEIKFAAKPPETHSSNNTFTNEKAICMTMSPIDIQITPFLYLDISSSVLSAKRILKTSIKR